MADDLTRLLREMDERIKAPATTNVHAPGSDDGLTAIQRIVDALPDLLAFVSEADDIAFRWKSCDGDSEPFYAARRALAAALKGEK